MLDRYRFAWPNREHPFECHACGNRDGVGDSDLVDRVYAIADEDMDRTTDEKTSAVHFMRFELTKQMITALKQGSELSMGIDHPGYQITLDPVPAQIRASLLQDLQS